jgi:hypothetical protein
MLIHTVMETFFKTAADLSPSVDHLCILTFEMSPKFDRCRRRQYQSISLFQIRDLNFEIKTLERNFDSILRLSEILTTEFRVDAKFKEERSFF